MMLYRVIPLHSISLSIGRVKSTLLTTPVRLLCYGNIQNQIIVIKILHCLSLDHSFFGEQIHKLSANTNFIYKFKSKLFFLIL